MFYTDQELLEKSFMNLQLSGYTPDQAAEILGIKKSESTEKVEDTPVEQTTEVVETKLETKEDEEPKVD